MIIPVSGFADKAGLWETRLASLDSYLHDLNQIQRKWVFLEPIFGRGALPREQVRFSLKMIVLVFLIKKSKNLYRHSL